MNNSFDESNRLVIAFIGKPVGLKGHLRIHPQSDFLTQFQKGNQFKINDNSIEVEYFDAEKMMVKFKDFNSIDEAKVLSGKELCSTIEDSRKNCTLKEDEFFWFDIITCQIIENGEVLGVVDEIERFTGQDYLFVTTDTKLIEKKYPKSFLIPYSERYIVSVDITLKTIVTMNAKDILEAS